MISQDAQALGHRYVMGNVNAYCLACSNEATAREGRVITVLTCDYDLDDDEDLGPEPGTLAWWHDHYQTMSTSALILELIRLRVEDALADHGTLQRHNQIGAVVTLLRERRVLDA